MPFFRQRITIGPVFSESANQDNIKQVKTAKQVLNNTVCFAARPNASNKIKQNWKL